MTFASRALAAVLIAASQSKHTVIATNHLRHSNYHRSLANIQVSDGLWVSRGYGLVVDIASSNDTHMVLEQTASNCIRNDFIVQFLDEISPQEAAGDVALIKSDQLTVPYVMDKVQDANAGLLLTGCANGQRTLVKGDAEYIRDPFLDFDVLVQTFDEQYAFSLCAVSRTGKHRRHRQGTHSRQTRPMRNSLAP